MVKRLLTIACLALATFGAQAQTLQINPASKFQTKHVRRAPAKVASLDGAEVFGYGTTSGWEGLGVNATNVKFDVAIYIPGSNAFKGATINGINIPVLDKGMKDVSAWVRSGLDSNDLAKATAAGPFVEGEYFAVAFDEAVPVPADGFYAGYTFTCSVAYPIATGSTYVQNGLLLQYAQNGEASGWADYSSQFGASPLQVFISGIQLPDYSIQLTAAGLSVQLPNSPYSLYVEAVGSSAKEIKNLDVEVTADGKSEMQHITLPEALETGINKSTTFLLTGTSPAQVGRYDVDITVKKVNGQDYTESAQIKGLLKNLSRMVQRNTVIEEFTGTGCGWCTRGWVGMEYMKEKYPDNFIGIAFHKYNSSDPMYYANYPKLGLTGAPGCMIDRKAKADPFYGFGQDEYGIEDAFLEMNSQPAEVEAKVSALWNENQTAVDITSDVEFLIETNPVSLVYVLTADSLTGASASWKQSNFYTQYASNGTDEGIDAFCNGGSKGQSSVTLVFNDVVIGSSYNSQQANQGSTISSDQITAGAINTDVYTINMPTKAALKIAVKPQHVYANVLVVDNVTGEVLNAARTHVAKAGEDAIDMVKSTASATTYRYNAAGQAIAAPQRGLNIVRSADGKVRKVMVK